MKTTIINLMGGPGCGKSTMAAGVFHELKNMGLSVELVREYVKDWAWRGRQINKYDEVYLFSKQLQAESTLYGKVEFIVTDSPLFMSAAYEKLHTTNKVMLRLFHHYRAAQRKDGIRHIDLLVDRQKEYVSAGRFHSEEQAKAVDAMCAWGDSVRSVGGVLQRVELSGWASHNR